MKRLTSTILCLAMLFALMPSAFAAPVPPEIIVPSAFLMERSTGKVLFEKNADEKRAVASITKVMTLLITVEAVDSGLISLTDKITISQNAMNMGGSTANLAAGEVYTVDELLKAVTVQSANDGAYAFAEFLAGSQDSFVAKMNERAAQLGMSNTQFKNCHGLDEEGHYSTARDVAIMSRELLSHPLIKNYSTIWMDTLRDGACLLTNTNKLVRFYEGATGLKTGSTSGAGACVTASAERNSMELIAVVLRASSGDERWAEARKLLDFGFANYQLVNVFPEAVPLPIPVLLGKQKEIQPILKAEKNVVVEKSKVKSLVKTVTMTENVTAPVEQGQKLGELTVSCDGETLAVVPFTAAEPVEKITFGYMFGNLLKVLFLTCEAE